LNSVLRGTRACNRERLQFLNTQLLPGHSVFFSVIAEIMKLAQSGVSIGPAMIQFGMKHLYDLFRQAGVVPGLEFITAISTAETLKPPARIELGDQDVSVTLANLWNALLGVLPLFLSGVPPDFSKEDQESWYKFVESFATKNPDKIEETASRICTRKFATKLSQIIKRLSPAFYQSLLDDRDQILTRSMIDCGGTKIVGVVGIGHMDGIERYWNDREALAKAERERATRGKPGPFAGFLNKDTWSKIK